MQSNDRANRQALPGQRPPDLSSSPNTPYRNPTVVIPAPSPSAWQKSSPNDHRFTASQPIFPKPKNPIPQRPHPAPTPGVSNNGIPASVDTPDLPVDYRLLLLALSDYYITEARSLAALIAHSRPGADDEMYYKLMAMGMGCLETVLKKLSRNMPPRQVATLQLRYASLLYEETDNDKEAEAMLSQAVTFCDNNRLPDLKYSMQHLLARVLFKSNIKVSLKYLDNVIRDASTYQHVSWIYAFRFLRVSLLMQHATQHDIFAAIHDLVAIAETAKSHGDTAVGVVAAVLEALIHLRSRDVEAMRETQRAIATARAEQLNITSKTLPQLTALVHFVDLTSSLSPYNHGQAAKKMSLMQVYLDEIISTDNWSRDGTFGVPITSTTVSGLTTDTGGIFTKDSEGRDCLTFTWLGKADVYLIGFLLSGATLYYRNHQDGRSEKYLSEGLKMTEDSYQITEAPSTLSLTTACNRTRFRKIIQCYMLLHQTFALCERSAWPAMETSLQSFMTALQTPGLEPPPDLHRIAIYLQAITSHATGNLDAALALYRDPYLAFPQSSKAFTSPTHEILAVLACLNVLFIIRPTTHPQHSQIDPILAHLEPYFPSTSNSNATTTHLPEITTNPHLRALHHLHTAFLTPTLTLKKKHLSASLALANTATSSSLQVLVLSFLASAFFGGQTGDEAREHVVGARTAAKQAGSKLWTCVTDGMLAAVVEREGRGAEAEKFWEEGEKLLGALTPRVREKFEADTTSGAPGPVARHAAAQDGSPA